MFTTMRSLSSAIALSLLLLPSSARVIWIPEEFDPNASSSLLQPRDAGTCGGDSSLTYCGGDMPSGFCCSSGYSCLAIKTNSAVTAAMCCPQGSDCAIINPISCDMSLQNSTVTQLHADPPQKLKSCGDACCPMGYHCENNQCKAEAAPTKPSKTPTSTSSLVSSTTASTTKSSTTSADATPTSAGSAPLDGARPTESDSEGSDFNGKSFAAGFLPGIAIGAFIAACLILLWLRKKRCPSRSYVDEKGNVRDTLTDLGPLDRRPTTHGRSISEPKADPSAGYRTDFLRSTPPRAADGAGTIANGYIVDVRSPASGPATPSSSPPKVRALFSRSPFMAQYPSTPPSTQPPIPAHLKRGTLSFKISPVRALKKQKSMHSLRRQMTDGSTGTNNSRRKNRQDLSRSASSGSTETIQVLMPSNEPYTPERRVELPDHIQTLGSATYQPPSTSTTTTTWSSTNTSSESSSDNQQHPTVTYASSSRYPSDAQQQTYTTPTRPPVPRLPTAPAGEATLGSPYTPKNHAGVNGNGKAPAGGSGGLTVERSESRRDTTFSAMMERAGLRKSDLMVSK